MSSFSRIIFLLTLSTIVLVGCSDNENENNQATEPNDTNQETSTQQTENSGEDQTNDSNEENADESDDNNDEHVEHQEGLKMGETGIVEDEKEKYEVTLNEIEYADVVGGLDVNNDIYAIVNLTVKNIDDHTFNAKNIYPPSFGTGGNTKATLNEVFLKNPDNVDRNLLEGEIKPGESVTGDHVFDIDKADEYLLAIGGGGAQIQTYAQWEVSDNEIE